MTLTITFAANKFQVALSNGALAIWGVAGATPGQDTMTVTLGVVSVTYKLLLDLADISVVAYPYPSYPSSQQYPVQSASVIAPTTAYQQAPISRQSCQPLAGLLTRPPRT